MPNDQTRVLTVNCNAGKLLVHTMLVFGGRDPEAGTVSVHLHHGGPQGAKPKANILAGIKGRRT